MKTSAGRLRELGIKDDTSLRGARAADWAAEKIASRRELCRAILSPLPPHPTWWSPYGSATGVANKGTGRHLRKSGAPASIEGTVGTRSPTGVGPGLKRGPRLTSLRRERWQTIGQEL